MANIYRISRGLILIAFFLGFCPKSFGQSLRIAVAANAQGVIKKLQEDFKKSTGIETEIIIGASGKLAAQIMNGAPYHVFLSADTEFPEKLFAAGFGLEKPKVYALGSLILYGVNSIDLKNWQMLIQSAQIKKIAIANPLTAPYGKAATEAFKYYHLDRKIDAKLVYGESISQVNTYLKSGAVDFGFTTESLLYDLGNQKVNWIRIDQKSYSPIAQSAILIANTPKPLTLKAKKFYDYLFSPAAKKIISKNGYSLPK